MLITDKAEFWLKVGEMSPPYALDLETTGLDPHTDTILFAVLGDTRRGMAVSPQLLGELQTLPGPLILHNQKYDLHMLYRAGYDLRHIPTYDTMLMHHLYDENASHSLGDIVLEMFGDDYKKKFWAKYKDLKDAPEEESIEYACKDAVYTCRIYEHFAVDAVRCRLEGREPLINWGLVEHQHRLSRALMDTEFRGLLVDLPYLVDLSNRLQPLIHGAREEMTALVPSAVESVRLDMHAKQINEAWRPKGTRWRTLPVPSFNWGSHQQVAALLYNKLQLPRQYNVDKKTKEKRISTDDAALEKLESYHPLVGKLREYSTYQKVYSAFIEGTLERVKGDRIYPSFNVNGTVTGRISSSDPNLQQLPSKGEWAKVRGIYRAPLGSKIISADYDQLEVVIAAHFSQDPNLLRIVLGGESKHDITASALGVPRGTAKTINFAMQYGCGPKKVAEIMGLPIAEDSRGRPVVPPQARKAWDTYWRTYAGEKRVRDECAARVRAGLPIVSPWGRVRHFPQPEEYAERWMVSAAERQAYSALIQGTGADCCHWAFYTVADELTKRGWGYALFEVHDQILICVLDAYVVQASELLRETMVAAGKQIDLSVPLGVKVEEASERWVK